MAKKKAAKKKVTRATGKPNVLLSVAAICEYLRAGRLVAYAGKAEATSTELMDLVMVSWHVPGTTGVYRLNVVSQTPHSGRGTVPVPTDQHIPESLLDKILTELADEDSDLRRLSTLPIQRTFVYLDVTEFSKYEPLVQLLVLNTVTNLSDQAIAVCTNTEHRCRPFERRLPIGDGYIFSFHRPVDACWFAVMLAYKVHRHTAEPNHPEIHFRIGVHGGDVFSFRDDHAWNYTGAAINDAQRVLTAIGKEQDDVVFLSGWAHSELMKVTKDNGAVQHRLAIRMLAACINRGRRQDKHEKWHRLYELNHVSAYRG